jgi:hypothetical protein
MYAAQYVLMVTDYALSSPFDTAASKSVFTTPHLFITDVAPIDSSTLILSVQQGAPGVRMGDVGNFRDLGKVNFGKEAACSNLASRM